MGDLQMKNGGFMLVCDGEKGLFLRNEGDELFPNLQVYREMAQDNPPNREQGSAPPGRSFDRTSPGRSAYEETDWHRMAKEEFAREMAARLYRYAREKRYDQLIVVAPPRVLGELRKEMHREVTRCIIAEIDKELTGHPIDQIEAHLLKPARPL